MNLGKLQILKKMMGEATSFAEPFNYFMDEFAKLNSGSRRNGNEVQSPPGQAPCPQGGGVRYGGHPAR